MTSVLDLWVSGVDIYTVYFFTVLVLPGLDERELICIGIDYFLYPVFKSTFNFMNEYNAVVKIRTSNDLLSIYELLTFES